MASRLAGFGDGVNKGSAPAPDITNMADQQIGSLKKEEIEKIPPDVLSKVHPSKLSKINKDVLAKLPLNTLANLPFEIRKELPVEKRVELLGKFLKEVQRQIPPSSKRNDFQQLEIREELVKLGKELERDFMSETQTKSEANYTQLIRSTSTELNDNHLESDKVLELEKRAEALSGYVENFKKFDVINSTDVEPPKGSKATPFETAEVRHTKQKEIRKTHMKEVALKKAQKEAQMRAEKETQMRAEEEARMKAEQQAKPKGSMLSSAVNTAVTFMSNLVSKKTPSSSEPQEPSSATHPSHASHPSLTSLASTTTSSHRPSALAPTPSSAVASPPSSPPPPAPSSQPPTTSWKNDRWRSPSTSTSSQTAPAISSQPASTSPPLTSPSARTSPPLPPPPASTSLTQRPADTFGNEARLAGNLDQQSEMQDKAGELSNRSQGFFRNTAQKSGKSKEQIDKDARAIEAGSEERERVQRTRREATRLTTPADAERMRKRLEGLKQNKPKK